MTKFETASLEQQLLKIGELAKQTGVAVALCDTMKAYVYWNLPYATVAVIVLHEPGICCII